MASRLRAFVDQVAQDHQESTRTILVVAHRGSLRILLCLLLGLGPRSHWQFRLEPASLLIRQVRSAGAFSGPSLGELQRRDLVRTRSRTVGSVESSDQAVCHFPQTSGAH